MSECRKCKKKHPKAFMAKHMKSRHPTETVSYNLKCQICEKTFKSSMLYGKHVRSHEGLYYILVAKLFYNFK